MSLTKQDFVEYTCNNCGYEGNDFEYYYDDNEGNLPHWGYIAECPECNHGNIAN